MGQDKYDFLEEMEDWQMSSDLGIVVWLMTTEKVIDSANICIWEHMCVKMQLCI